MPKTIKKEQEAMDKLEQPSELVTVLKDALEHLGELAALVRGECPSLLEEDSGGNARLSMDIDDALARGTAMLARLTS